VERHEGRRGVACAQVLPEVRIEVVELMSPSPP
jgi:hypothetical protein